MVTDLDTGSVDADALLYASPGNVRVPQAAVRNGDRALAT